MSAAKQRPLLSGERVQLRLSGQKPVLVADAETLALVLDPSHLSVTAPIGSNAATFSVRRGSQQIVGLSSVSGDATASVLDVGGTMNAEGATYLSVRTAGTDGTPDASMRMTERLRVGPGNQVSLPEATELVAYGNATVHRDLTVLGGLYASGYLNLVDDYRTASITRPPTANALRSAYVALSNLISANGGNSSGSGNLCYSSNAELFAVPAIACHALDAASYCNIVQDYLVSDARRPPSSAALAAAYAHLSNYVALQLQQIQYDARHSNVLDADVPPSASCVRVATDVWITGGGSSNQQRLWFPGEDTQLPTQFVTPQAFDHLAAFQWSSGTSSNVRMTLTHGGDVTMGGGLEVGGDCEVDGTLDVVGGITTTSSATVARLMVTSPSNAVVLMGKLDARGGYSNLPVALPDGQSVGMVRLMSSNVGGTDDAFGSIAQPLAISTAATVAGLWDVDRRAQHRTEALQGLLGEACYSAEVAKTMSIETSNVVYAFVDSPTFVRTYDVDANVKAVQVSNSNSSGGVHAGVSLDLAVGSGGHGVAKGGLTLTSRDLSLTGPGPAQIVLSTAGGVDIRAVAGAFIYHVLPPSPSSATLISAMEDGSASWYDASTQTTFTARASSVFDGSSNAAQWAMPIGAFDEDAESYWISDYGRYATDTGYPLLESVATTETYPILEGVNTLETVHGEWIQLDVATPPTIGGAYVGGYTLLIVNDNHVPDDFVLLGMDPRDDAWHILHRTVGQAARLRDAGMTGCLYTIAPPWTHRQMRGFRLVVTRISAVPGVDGGIFSSLAQVGRLSFVNASLNEPVPERSFTVEGGDVLVVDRQGRVGCGIGRDYLPEAQLHVRMAPSARAQHAALRIDDGGSASGAFEFRLGESNSPVSSTLYMDLPGGQVDGRFAVRGGPTQARVVALEVEGSTGDMRVSGNLSVASTIVSAYGVTSGCNVTAQVDVVASEGALRSEGGSALLKDASLGSESRVLERSRVDSRRLMPGMLFTAESPSLPRSRRRLGLASDLGSLSSGTAGLVGIGTGATQAASSIAELRTPISVEWTGLFQSDTGTSYSDYLVSFSNAEAPAAVRVGDRTLWTFGALVGSNVEAPVQLEAGAVLLPDAETLVDIDLEDRFIDAQVDWMMEGSSSYMTFELLSDPSGVIVDASSSSNIWKARGMYRDISTSLQVRATSEVTGLSVVADVAISEPGPPPPNLPRALGYLDVSDDSPRAVTDYDLLMYFEDATRPATGLTFEIAAASSDAAAINGGVLRIAPDFRGRNGYDVVVRGTSVGYPGSTATNTLHVTEPWPVVGRQWFPQVTLVDNYTASAFTLEDDAVHHYFADLVGQGLVYTIECDVEGAVTLGGVPWFNTTALPESDVSPAFPGAIANFQPPTTLPTSLAILGDYRNRTYDVTLVATSVAYPYMSARRVISVSEPRAPPPEPLMLSLGNVMLDWTLQEYAVDLQSAFMDMAMRGMSYTASTDAPESDVMIDVDGRTLKVRGAYRNVEYDINVYATSEPYGVRQDTPLILHVMESSQPPTATPRPPGYVLARVAATSAVPVRVSLIGEFRSGLESTALSYVIVGPPTHPLLLDSVYVDPQTSELVVRGASLIDISYTVTVRGVDAFGQFVDVVCTIANVAPPVIHAANVPSLLWPGTWTASAWFATSDTEPLTYSVSLPCGCMSSAEGTWIGASSGVLTVAEAAVGRSVEVRATDAFGQSTTVVLDVVTA